MICDNRLVAVNHVALRIYPFRGDGMMSAITFQMDAGSITSRDTTRFDDKYLGLSRSSVDRCGRS